MNIRDIAKLAEVSVSTVSKVINGKDKDISEPTRQKVLKIIRDYQYTPYSNIRESVTQQKESMIALVILNEQYLAPSFLEELEQQCASNGFSVLLCNIKSATVSELKNRLKIILAKRISGAIICTHDSELLEIAISVLQGTPLVAVTSFRSAEISTVRCDYYAAAANAISLFTQRGHQRIGCLLEKDDFSVYDQICNGIITTMNTNAIVPNNHNIITLRSGERFQESDFQRLINRNLTAIYCQSEPLMKQLYEYLLLSNIHIPQNLSLICGIRDYSHLPSHIASYEIPYAELAGKATQLLLQAITDRDTMPIQDICLPMNFFKSDSISSPQGFSAPILVLGNCAYDTILPVSDLPSSCQLQISSNVIHSPGGKCVSTAIAASRLGGTVHAIGRVGNDPEGHAVINTLAENGVHTKGVLVDSTAMTGRSYLTSATNGDYTIIAHSGANRFLTIQAIKNMQYILPSASICLISTEVPFNVVKYLMQKCVTYKIKVFLKPSVPIPVDPAILRHIDYCIPSESELNQLIPGSQSIQEKADQLYALGCPNVIVTMADNSCYLKNDAYSLYIPAANFRPVETASAVNCFIAAFAISLSQGADILFALSYATYAAGISLSQSGMYSSFPYRMQVDLYLEEINNFYMSLLKQNDLALP